MFGCVNANVWLLSWEIPVFFNSPGCRCWWKVLTGLSSAPGEYSCTDILPLSASAADKTHFQWDGPRRTQNKTLAALMNLPHAGAWLCLLAEPWCAASCRGAANTLPSIIQRKHTAQQVELRLQMTKAEPKDYLKCDSSYSVLHWLLHEVEALPARVELVLVRAFEVQQVANDLEEWQLEIFISRAEGTTCFEQKS